MIAVQEISSSIHERLNSVTRQVGNTPLLPIVRLHTNPRVKIYAKAEWQQLGGSVKSRPALSIIRSAIQNGELHENRHLLDATSGNTGIAYAAIGAKLGIPVTLCIPENVSKKRKAILAELGATVIYTSKFDSTDGAQEKARELAAAYPEKYYYADQYNNPANWQAHYHGTALEIFRQTGGQITHFVAGLGTTGTFVGTGRRLKQLKPGIRLIALHPDTALHGLEGWKHLDTAKVPGIYDHQLVDENRLIDTIESYEMIKTVAEKENLLLSPSAAANLIGALKIANELDEGVLVTVFPDNGEKYDEVLQQIFNS
jgi:cysteine synthase B